jgi:hypothetical protein
MEAQRLVRSLRAIHRRVWQRGLVLLKPNPIAHVDIAAAERAFPEMLGFAQSGSGDLSACAGASRLRLVHWHDRGQVHLSKKYGPGIASEAKPDRRGVHPPAAISFSYRHGRRRCQTTDRRAVGSDWLRSSRIHGRLPPIRGGQHAGVGQSLRDATP